MLLISIIIMYNTSTSDFFIYLSHAAEITLLFTLPPRPYTAFSCLFVRDTELLVCCVWCVDGRMGLQMMSAVSCMQSICIVMPLLPIPCVTAAHPAVYAYLCTWAEAFLTSLPSASSSYLTVLNNFSFFAVITVADCSIYVWFVRCDVVSSDVQVDWRRSNRARQRRYHCACW